MKKSPAEKLLNQITKVQSRLDFLNTKLTEDNKKGHNFLPPNSVYDINKEPNGIIFNFDDIETDGLKTMLKPTKKRKLVSKVEEMKEVKKVEETKEIKKVRGRPSKKVVKV